MHLYKLHNHTYKSTLTYTLVSYVEVHLQYLTVLVVITRSICTDVHSSLAIGTTVRHWTYTGDEAKVFILMT